MWDLKACTVCFSTRVKLYSLNVGTLRKDFNLVSGLQTVQGNGMPEYLCVECTAYVKKCKQFREKCHRAHYTLAQILIKNKEIKNINLKVLDRQKLNIMPSLSYIDLDKMHYKQVTFKLVNYCRTSVSQHGNIPVAHYTTLTKEDTFEFEMKDVKENEMSSYVKIEMDHATQIDVDIADKFSKKIPSILHNALNDQHNNMPLSILSDALEGKNDLSSNLPNNTLETVEEGNVFNGEENNDAFDLGDDTDNNMGETDFKDEQFGLMSCKLNNKGDGSSFNEEYAKLIPISVKEAKAAVEVYKFCSSGSSQYSCSKRFSSESKIKQHACRHDIHVNGNYHCEICDNEIFREGTYIPWGKVAIAMDNRTKIQVYNKYTRMIERRKGRFLEEEDVVILKCYEKYGLNFKKMSDYLPGRSAVQLRTRFKLLTKFRLSKTWTVQDDKKLIQIMANLDSNSSFSNATAHFPGKDRMHLRSRYITLMKWMKAHPATDISMAPRRGARKLVHGYTEIDLNEAVANLNKRIQTQVKTKKSKRISIFSQEEDIEDGIMAALMNEIIKEEATRKPDRSEMDEISPSPSENIEISQNTTNLRKILIFLNSALDKNKFNKSKYAKKHQGLVEIAPEVGLLKVKSYSKKQSVKTIQMDGVPDVWGNLTTGATSYYVLPPNYATITGCRVLMKLVGSIPEEKSEDEFNLSLMAHRNVFLRDALVKLKERFRSLFLSPIMISNMAPPVTDVSTSEIYVPKPKLQHTFLPHPEGLAIPRAKKSDLIFQAKQAKKLEKIENMKKKKA